ncbi:ATP-binding protein [Massilia aerilata]|uniref:ATP-binding protein n=1 Tax=Massilia aerilata TaxID=453817 RepID=A0ABW0RTM4_9BURK
MTTEHAEVASATASDKGTIIYGPQGCGKSAHAAALARHYGKDRIVDDWTPGCPVRADTLVLTNIPHENAVNFLDATRAAGIRLAPPLARALGAHRRMA